MTLPDTIPVFGEEQVFLLEKLSNACAISGDEGAVRAIIQEEIKQFDVDIKIDAIGNLLVTRKANIAHPLRVMLAAHMDEIGFMLVSKDEGGLFGFATIGGIDIRQLVGKPVLVGNKCVPGVIGACPIHLTTAEERSRSIPLRSLQIDLGPGGSDLARVGDRATFATRFRQVGPSFFGKALDDRLGVATLIEMIKYAPRNIELLAAFTVQEEIGMRGARVAAYSLNPDLAIVIDATPANDLPTWDGNENTRYNTLIDAGPAIYIHDAATLSDPRLIQLFASTAETAGIPYQFRQPGGGATDAGAIHRQRAGIPSVSLSVPLRYAHTAISLARADDWKHLLSLLHTVLGKLDKTLLTTK